MKNILWGIIVVMGLVLINEITYLGETSLAIVLMIFAVSIAILAYIQIQKL